MSNCDSINRRILIIDDNAAIHEDYRKVLCASNDNAELDDLAAELFGDSSTKKPAVVQKTFELESAYQGQEALKMVTQAKETGTPFAMAFVDMRMPPGWDGLETIQQIWKVDPNLNVVICTAYSDHSWSDMSAELGANDRWLLLRKPFDNAEVAQLAASLIAKNHLFTQLRAHMDSLKEEVADCSANLEKSEGRLEAVLDTAPDGIITCDDQGVVTSINQAAVIQLQTSESEAIGKSLVDFIFTEKDREKFDELFCKTDSLERLDLDCRIQRHDGSRFPAHWTIGRVRFADSISYTAIFRDETERERLRCDLTQSQKLEAVGQLAAGIAHEINTPTQFVAGNVEFLRDSFGDLEKLHSDLLELVDAGQPASSLKQRIEEIDLEYLREEIPTTLEQTSSGVQRIAKIVQAMKDFSHPGSEEKTLSDINAALESTITVAQNAWKYVADIETHLDPDLQAVPCLLAELNQVFINLIVNASHAIGDRMKENGGARGKITITTQRLKHEAVISIADTGGGIPDEIRDRVFEPFFTTKGVGKGTGQGLAVAHSVVVDKHGGKIGFETEPGVGTTFTIRLPLEMQSATSEDMALTAEAVV